MSEKKFRIVKVESTNSDSVIVFTWYEVHYMIRFLWCTSWRIVKGETLNRHYGDGYNKPFRSVESAKEYIKNRQKYEPNSYIKTIVSNGDSN